MATNKQQIQWTRIQKYQMRILLKRKVVNTIKSVRIIQ